MNNQTEQIFIVNALGTLTAAPKIIEPVVFTQGNADFSTVCRTCATVTEFVIPIFDGEGLQNNLADKIHKHLPIQKIDKIPPIKLNGSPLSVEDCIKYLGRMLTNALKDDTGVVQEQRALLIWLIRRFACCFSEVSENDMLPVVVCYQCASTLLAWHELVQCCVQADAALRARLQPDADPAASELNSSNVIQKLEQEQQPQWEPCSVDVKPALPEDGGPIGIEQDTDYRNHYDFDSDPGGSCGSGNEDDKPLSSLASKKAADLYHDFYRALVNFRNHFAEKHDLYDRSDSASAASSDSETSSERIEPDASVDSYDDLTHCNMRRDRMDEATRLELARVRTRVGGRARYACPECGKLLSSPHTYVFHARIHTGARPCVCHVCGKQFRAPHALRRHLTETHERARRHACPQCGKTFANSQNLKQHTRIHTGERPYACAQCGKRFAQSGSLHVHAKTHSGVLAHACRECGARFRLRAGLARHTLRHTGERPHACPQCARAFKLRHELAAHALLHASARPHACAACPATFRQRRAARQHARTHHAPPPAPTHHAPPPAPTHHAPPPAPTHHAPPPAPDPPHPGPAYSQIENY